MSEPDATGNPSSKISIPLFAGKSIDVNGPSWLVLVLVGAIMVAAPILAAFGQKPGDVTEPPITVQRVQVEERMPDDNLDGFIFSHDTSVVDLRGSQTEGWASKLRGAFGLASAKNVKPTVITNTMTLKKTKDVTTLVLTYSTSHSMVVRCLSHTAEYKEKVSDSGGRHTDAWAILIDVSSIPRDSDFEVIVEATYFDAFSDSNSSDYSTYGNRQQAPEELSMLLIFPTNKPMKRMSIFEYPPSGGGGSQYSGFGRTYEDPSGSSYYWTTHNTRSDYYYTLRWDW